MENKDLFLSELKQLLEKYNSGFWIDLEGDTHGVSSFLVVDIDNKEILRKHQELDKYDLKNY